MAKTRVKSTRTRRRTASARPGTGRPKKVSLKPVYRELKGRVSELKRVAQTKQVKFAITRLTRCMNELDDICGPDMVIETEPTR